MMFGDAARIRIIASTPQVDLRVERLRCWLLAVGELELVPVC